MVGLMSATQVPEANCAICGAPPFPECPHEGERLELALNQAWDRWIWTETIRCVSVCVVSCFVCCVLCVCCEQPHRKKLLTCGGGGEWMDGT